MKKAKLIFLGLMATMLMISAISCKKEDPPQPAPATTQTSNDTTVSLGICLVDYTDMGGVYTAPVAKLVSSAGDTSAPITLTVNVSTTYSAYPSACSYPSLTYNMVSKTFDKTSFYRVCILDGSTPLRTLKITKNNIVDEGPGGTQLGICSYSPNRVTIGL